MKPSPGFTLVELMVTIALVGIIATVAVPSWMRLIEAERLTTVTNSLVAALTYARSEAVQSGNPVSICASSDGATCTGAADWSVGWLVYEDSNGNGTPDTGEVRRVWNALDDTLNLTGPNGQLTYEPAGTLASVAQFDLEPASCDPGQPRHRDISVNISGQTYSEPAPC